MANLNVDELNKNVQHSESQHRNNINGQECNDILQKEQELEESLQNEDIVTELKDKRNWNRAVHSSTFKKDTVINIGVSETGSLAYHIGRKKSRLWPFSFKRLFTKHIKSHDDQRQKEHLYQGSKGLSKQRVIVLFQEYGYGTSKGPPLNYDPETQNSFVLLVMIIVLIMLLLTIAFIAVVLSVQSIKDFFQHYRMFIFISATITQLACTYILMCSACSRQPPGSFIVLIITVVSMSALASLISSHYRTEIVLYAVIATAAIVITCAGLALTSFDFTKWLLYVVVIGAAFLVVTVIIYIVMKVTGNYMKSVHLVILYSSVILQSVVLVIQLQTILGGRSVELGVDDYALGAFMLYTSIVDIFIKMVYILGLSEEWD